MHTAKWIETYDNDMSGDPDQVTCPACGTQLARTRAREYDRHGDRWDRDGKEFEYLCKPCHRAACHLPRGELKETLEAVGKQPSPEAFVAAYYREVDANEHPGT